MENLFRVISEIEKIDEKTSEETIDNIFGYFWDSIVKIPSCLEQKVYKAIPNKQKDLILREWNNYIKVLEKQKNEYFCNDEQGLLDYSTLEKEGYKGISGELELIDESGAFSRCSMCGTGYNPETIIEIKRIYRDSKILCIDSDSDAILKSREYIMKVVPAHMDFTFSNVLAEKFDYKNEELIFIANGIMNKAELLRRIHETAVGDISILIRLPKKMGGLLYENLTYDEINNIGFCIVREKESSILSRTLLLKKI